MKSMDEKRRFVADCWEANARAWTTLTRAGFDHCRDACNTPRFFEMLPDVAGLHGLDIGCGEGHNTRIAARKGARMTAVEQAPTFVRFARGEEAREPLGIDYRTGNAEALPFGDGVFDFAVSTMCFQDMASPAAGMREAFRTLKPGGFFQFSILHPCFMRVGSRWEKDAAGRKTARIVADYFTRSDADVVDEWMFGAAGAAAEGFEKFKVPYTMWTMSEWVNTLLDAGFALERMGEPFPSDAMLDRYPAEYDQRIVPFYLHLRGRKPR